MKNKIFDCITFFKENFITNIRFEILSKYVDYFVICESKFDHNGKRKKLNFQLKNLLFKDKIIYIILDHPFPESLKNGWERQAYQRDYMLSKISKVKPNDYIMFSDPDEIPNPKKLKNFSLKKKYAIFMQDHYVYKFNIFNKYDTPWEGTRVCRFKNLKSIDYMRQKVLLKNLKKWWRPDKEKNIDIISNGGWHFKDIFTPRDLSIKLKTFAHKEFNASRFSNISIIKKKIRDKKDLYNKNQLFYRVKLNKGFPRYILNNREKFKKFID
jgi:beta-1,4-mannosyl-glycoprotein beta-1,4-N-acetylglucosaminyltransferase